MKKSTFYVGLFLLFISILACSDDNKKGLAKEEYDPSKPVKITRFFPESGRIREKVILEGENFGSDPEKIKVYFNDKRAAVIGSSGKSMYVLVPRLTQEDATISVVVGKDSLVYDEKFDYTVTISVSTVAGDGTRTIRTGPLEQSQIAPFMLDIDDNGNIFVGTDNVRPGAAGWSSSGIIRINEEENIMEMLYEFPNVYGNRFDGLSVDKKTSKFFGTLGTGANTYAICDPTEGWIPRFKIMEYKESAYAQPTDRLNFSGFNNADGHLYTRYNDGKIAKINPETGVAEIIFQTPERGMSIGIDFDPNHPNMMYIAGYNSQQVAHGIWSLDLTDPKNTWKRLNTSTTAGHRDGPIEQALFFSPYGIRFDRDGLLYIADSNNFVIRRYNPSTGIVETVLGKPRVRGFKDGGKDDALFNFPTAIGVSKEGNVYVADRENFRVRKLSIE